METLNTFLPFEIYREKIEPFTRRKIPYNIQDLIINQEKEWKLIVIRRNLNRKGLKGNFSDNMVFNLDIGKFRYNEIHGNWKLIRII